MLSHPCGRSLTTSDFDVGRVKRNERRRKHACQTRAVGAGEAGALFAQLRGQPGSAAAPARHTKPGDSFQFASSDQAAGSAPPFLAHRLIKVPRGTGAKAPDFPARGQKRIEAETAKDISMPN